MATNYDNIAGTYDFLSRLIFGRQIIDAQVSLLKYVPADSSILIAGGGTGWILERLAAVHAQGLEIDYIESSERMIALSQKRNFKNNVVNFIHRPIEDLITEKKYDIVITPFLFDNFRKEKLEFVFTKLDSFLKPDGLWLYTDFDHDKSQKYLWQKLLLRAMYFFFRIMSTVEAKELSSIKEYFAPSYSIEFDQSFYFKFIRSVAYRKK